jgi:hypothetical protein
MTTDATKTESRPLRLPGFLNENEIGMGDAIKRVTSYLGIAPCRSCHARAAALNRWVVFSAKSGVERTSSSK